MNEHNKFIYMDEDEDDSNFYDDLGQFNSSDYENSSSSRENSWIKTNPNSTWNQHKGYLTNAFDTYPPRALGLGEGGGLYANLYLEDFRNLDFTCQGIKHGYKIIVHAPNELPQFSKHFLVPLEKEVLVSIRPNMINTSNGLRNYDAHDRQCFFNDERHLKYFKIYTQSNCELECLSNFTYSECGCVKFSMPRDSKMKICKLQNVDCYKNVEGKLFEKRFGDYNSRFINANNSENTKSTCDCLPSCTSLSYDVEISQTDLDSENYFEQHIYNAIQDDGKKWYPKTNARYSDLSIFFKENHFFALKRSELYGFSDFVANIGGLLG